MSWETTWANADSQLGGRQAETTGSRRGLSRRLDGRLQQPKKGWQELRLVERATGLPVKQTGEPEPERPLLGQSGVRELWEPEEVAGSRAVLRRLRVSVKTEEVQGVSTGTEY